LPREGRRNMIKSTIVRLAAIVAVALTGIIASSTGYAQDAEETPGPNIPILLEGNVTPPLETSPIMWRVRSQSGGAFFVFGEGLNRVLFLSNDCSSSADMTEGMPYELADGGTIEVSITYTYSDNSGIHVGDTANPIQAVKLEGLCWILMVSGATNEAVVEATSRDNPVEPENTPTLFTGALQTLCTGPNCGTPNDGSSNWISAGAVNRVLFLGGVGHDFNLDDTRFQDYFADNGDLSYTYSDGTGLKAGETSLDNADVIENAVWVLFVLDNGIDG
jgi:hypothetical protein